MNFKKTLTVAAIASIAAVGLASCNKGADDDSKVTLNLALSYKGDAYITYNRSGLSDRPSTYTTLDGMELISKESLLPVWQKIQKNLNFTVVDAAPDATDTSEMMKSVIGKNLVGRDDKKVDVLQVMSAATEFTDNVGGGKFLNLSKYQDKLPDLFKFLEENSGVSSQMQLVSNDGEEGVFFAPYFDGKDQIEKGFNMNLEAVRALLDDAEVVYSASNDKSNRFKHAADYDTAATLTTSYGGVGTTNTSSYIQSLSEQTIAVAGADGKASTIKVSFAKDIATIQNGLEVKNGKTLTEALKSYIDTVYGAYIGEGKLYATRSEIFTSASACYNADELIALLRCIKTNPNYLTGKANATMIPFFPRTGEANRVRAFVELSQIFGVRGTLSGEKDQLWYNADGELVDGRTQEYNYIALDKLNAMQNEGLFPTNWLYDGSTGKSEFRSAVFKDGTGFMCYDYTNVAAFNKLSGAVITEMEQVLSPVAKWPVQKDNGGKDIVGYNSTEKVSYTRFSEDNRALKDGGWALSAELANSGNEAKLNKALQLVNYLYTQEGSFIEAFGTDGKDGVYASSIATDASGVSYPVLTQKYKDEIQKMGKGTWHNFMTWYQGSCLGIGNIRSTYLEAQVTDARQEAGLQKIATAEDAGAMYTCKTYGEKFFKSVETTFPLSQADSDGIKANAKFIQDFWNITTNSTTKAGEGEVLKVVRTGWASAQEKYSSLTLVKAGFAASNDSYLKYTSTSIGATADSTNQYPYFK